jgi:transcriptional regulator
MNRRDLLSTLALVGAVAEGQQSASSPETVYIPKVQRVEDRKFLHDFMDEFSFADLVTAAPTIRITHIPVILDRDIGPYGTIYGHISKNNTQQQAFDGNAQAVIVFHGPESYISPTWYEKAEAVPTWNFAVVHASGKLKAVTDPKALHEFLGKLIHKFESRYPQSTYDFSKLPDTYVYPMINGIIGFEMKIEEIEGKCKLGQDRSEADRQSIVKHLTTAWREPSMSEFTANFYERQKKSQA